MTDVYAVGREVEGHGFRKEIGTAFVGPWPPRGRPRHPAEDDGDLPASARQHAVRQLWQGIDTPCNSIHVAGMSAGRSGGI